MCILFPLTPPVSPRSFQRVAALESELARVQSEAAQLLDAAQQLEQEATAAQEDKVGGGGGCTPRQSACSHPLRPTAQPGLSPFSAVLSPCFMRADTSTHINLRLTHSSLFFISFFMSSIRPHLYPRALSLHASVCPSVYSSGGDGRDAAHGASPLRAGAGARKEAGRRRRCHHLLHHPPRHHGRGGPRDGGRGSRGCFRAPSSSSPIPGAPAPTATGAAGAAAGTTPATRGQSAGTCGRGRTLDDFPRTPSQM
jgi:hypothetical protein